MSKIKGPLAAAITTNVLVALGLLMLPLAFLVTYLLFPSPSLAVTEATVDHIKYGYHKSPVEPQMGLVMKKMNMSLKLEMCNANGHSTATFWPLQLRISFSDVILSVVRANQPLRLPAMDVMTLDYVATTINVSLGHAGTWDMEEVHHSVAFTVAGEAVTHRKVYGIINIQQLTRLSCSIRFRLPHGTALPFRCRSKAKFAFWDDVHTD